MNDLKNGIIDIDGFLLTPQTRVEELETFFGLKAWQTPYRSHFDLGGKTFTNEGIDFKVDISLKNTVVEVQLYPQFPDVSSTYGVGGEWRYPTSGNPDTDLAYFREVREILDKWLEKQLGAPTHKGQDVTEYKMGNILLGTDSYLDTRSRDVRVVGGTVDIYYR